MPNNSIVYPNQGYVIPATTVPLRKRSFIVGDGVNSLYTINHDLDTVYLFIVVRENFEPYNFVEMGHSFDDGNSVVVDFGDPIEDKSYIVTLFG